MVGARPLVLAALVALVVALGASARRLAVAVTSGRARRRAATPPPRRACGCWAARLGLSAGLTRPRRDRLGGGVGARSRARPGGPVGGPGGAGLDRD